MTPSDRTTEVVATLEEVTGETRAAFGGLSDDLLNWKPTAAGWSIAQCLERLITINHLYFPVFESMSSGPARPTFWEKHSPFSGLFGRS